MGMGHPDAEERAGTEACEQQGWVENGWDIEG